ncbi:Leishmanolysin-like peptidase [Dissostichus eleginoides]|uniref:Leishmanolysin-like peptidase n=1 Tax=Dissostichus eleginoides TaxID=100907 RepID=A0AAD9FI31_DISEL|nr:Leishmanolysin-like peptidase [Dissostichus eleginoides]
MEGLSGARLLGPVLLLSSLAALVSCHPGTCRHQAPPPEEVVHQVHLKPERLTKRSSPEDLQLQIKIIYDHSVDQLPADQRRLVKDKLFPQAIDYLQKVLSVRRRVGPVLLSRQCSTNQYLRKRDDPHRYCQDACADLTRCGPVSVPQHHLQQCKVCSESGKSCGPIGPPDGPGVEGSDFVLYVSGVTTERCGQENIVAYAAYCQLEAELDRPIAGYANLCPAMISSQPQEFEGMLSTVKHEIIHALGFSAGLFAFYHDDEGKPLTPRFASGLPAFNESLGLYQWSEAVIRRVVRLWDIRGGEMVRHQVHVLVTPRVVEENEAMTGSHTQNRVFSRLTLALMEDSGWYRANYSLAERLDWGRGLGCDFVMKSCKFWIDRQRQRRSSVTPYCDTVRASPLQLTCRQDQLAVALALFGGAVEIADFCPFSQEFSWHLSGEYQRNSYCRVSLNQPDWWRNYGAEQYGSDSVCLYQKSAFIMEQCTRKMTYPDWGSGCYKDVSYLCLRAGQLLSVSVKLNDWVYNGQLICPACKDFCEHCPLQAPPLNASRSIPIDPCSGAPGLAFTLWLLMLNLLPLVAGLRLCTHS